MNTSYENTADLPQPDQVEAFVYQDTSGGAHGEAMEAPGTDAGGQKPGARDDVPRISEEELARLISEARAGGIHEGEQRTRASFEEQLAQERERISTAVAAFQRERDEYYAKIEVELIHMALAIAAKILHRESQVDRMLVAGLVKVMLEKLQQNTKVIVRVRPEEASGWRHYFVEDPNLQVVEDHSLQPRDCVVETELGTADMGLDAQLKEIEHGFFDLLAQRPGPR